MIDLCPNCDVQLAYWHEGNATWYSRKISVEVRGVYDGGLYNLCPECDHAWHRWGTGWNEEKRLHRIADPYIIAHNDKRLRRMLESTEGVDHGASSESQSGPEAGRGNHC